MNTKLKTTIGRVTAGLAAAAMVAGATAASADSRGRYDHRHHGGNGDAALVAGVVGLALGAAIASNHGSRYSERSYGYYDYPPAPRYYAPRHSYGYGYAPPRDYAPRGYGYGYGYGRDCWVTRDYDRRSGAVYERTVCR